VFFCLGCGGQNGWAEGAIAARKVNARTIRRAASQRILPSKTAMLLGLVTFL